ncbi:MAG: hypothetical protein E7220_02960 [Clostridiales bacterium]|nr:hypothetical protein [Clostridiales bacterium]
MSRFVFNTMKKMGIPGGAAFRMIRYGARDHARTPMQWDGSVNAGFNTGAETWQKVNPAYKEINVEADLASDKSVYRFYQKLLSVRKADSALIYGDTIEYRPDDRRLVCYSRTYEGRRLFVAGNFTGRKTTCDIPADFDIRDMRIVLSNYEGQILGQKMTLRPYEAVLFEEVK